MLCRDRCGYCTFAKPPARLDAPYLTPEAVLAIARRGAELGCHERCSPSAKRPRRAIPRRPTGSPTTGYASTVDYLVAVAELVLDETGLLPHANAGALDAGRARAAARGEPVAGDDDRDARGAPRRTRRPALRRARQDARAPPRDARSRGAGRAVAVHDGHPRRHRRDARRTHRGARRDRDVAPSRTVTCRK